MSEVSIRGFSAVIAGVALCCAFATAGAQAKVLDIDKFRVDVSGQQESSFTYSYTDTEETGTSCTGSGTERVEFSTPAPVKVRAALVRYRGTKRALWSFGPIARSGLGEPGFQVAGLVARTKHFEGSYSEDAGTCNYDGTPVDCAVSDSPVGWELALLGGSSSIGTDASVILGGPDPNERPVRRADTDVPCDFPSELAWFSYPQFGGTASEFFIEPDRSFSAPPIKRVFKDTVAQLAADGSYTLSGSPRTSFGDDSGRTTGEWHLVFERFGKPDKPK